MNTFVPSARCSVIALARPARLLKLRGVGWTAIDPARSSARWCFVEVLPKLPVIATIAGWTASRRRWARSTYGAARRSSIGRSTKAARSTTTSTDATTSAARAKGIVVKAAATPSAPSSTADVAASVRSRRVQASGAVRPRTDSPIGPTTQATPATAASGHTQIEAASAPTPRAASASDQPDAVHHRTAKRVAAPAR